MSIGIRYTPPKNLNVGNRHSSSEKDFDQKSERYACLTVELLLSQVPTCHTVRACRYRLVLEAGVQEMMT